MADSKIRINDLMGGGTLSDDTVFVIDGDTTNKITYKNLLDSIIGEMLTAETTNDILADAINIPKNQYRFFVLSGDEYIGSVPTTNYAWGKGFAINRNSSSLTVILFPESIGVPVINHRRQESWKGWQDFAGNPITHNLFAYDRGKDYHGRKRNKNK